MYSSLFNRTRATISGFDEFVSRSFLFFAGPWGEELGLGRLPLPRAVAGGEEVGACRWSGTWLGPELPAYNFQRHCFHFSF